MKRFLTVLGVALCGPGFLFAQAIDGVRDAVYCDPIAIQDTQTGFGNSQLGRIDVAGGSELDAAYAYVQGGDLYLFLAGNLESNGNDLEIFFDTLSGQGQQRLLNTNPNVDFDGLNRMGGDGTSTGLAFDNGFLADYYLTLQLINDAGTVKLFANYARLRVDEFDGGEGYYLGEGRAANETAGGALTGGDAGAPVVLATVNNVNTGGVSGGFSFDLNGLADRVTTGIEIRIPLSAIGNPSGDFKVCAFVNGAQHDFCSNQFLGGIFGSIADNLGNPQNVDLSFIGGDQFFTVSLTNETCGACCVTYGCITRSAAGCSDAFGDYQGDGTSCPDNDCTTQPSGACCLGTACVTSNATDCAIILFGTYLGDGTVCDGGSNPCLTGACCFGSSCQVLREADCAAQSGEYLGDFSNCDSFPCSTGACCLGGTCTTLRANECAGQGGSYLGNDTSCDPNPCNQGACCLQGECVVTLENLCLLNGGVYQGNLTTCDTNPCGAPRCDRPILDGVLDESYDRLIVVQQTQTQFGDANQGAVDFANGSELDAAYAKIVGGRLYLFIAGNLESNFNKLEIFFDTIEGEGQNRIRSDNPNVDFNGLNRMGDGPQGPGLLFDADFAPDYWISLTGGNNPYQMFANYAEMLTNGGGVGFFLGEGRAANATNGGLLDRNLGGNNSIALLATLNNSNVAGVSGGTGPADQAAAAAVGTGIELSVPLAAIGNPAGAFKVCVMVNGGGHDFLSNQVLGSLAPPQGNLGEPRLVDFTALAGDQFFTVQRKSPADVNGDGDVNNFDIDAFVAAIVSGDAETFYQLYPDGYYLNADVNGDCAVNNFDIDAFVACVVNGGC